MLQAYRTSDYRRGTHEDGRRTAVFAGRTPPVNGLSIAERQALVVSVVGLSHKMARGYQRLFAHRGNMYDDFVSAAFLGACKAARWWQADGGKSYSSYAATWMKVEIRAFVRNTLDITQRDEKYHPTITSAHTLRSDEEFRGEMALSTDRLERSAPDPWPALAALPADERLMVELRAVGGLTWKEIGARVGTYKEKVQQIVCRSFAELAERIAA